MQMFLIQTRNMDSKPMKEETRSGWADIPPELFDLILEKLPFVDKLRTKGVCHPWLSNVKNHISFLLQSQPPSLVFPSDEIYNGLCVAILEKKNVLKSRNLPREFDEGCIGSSKGWLVFENENENICLFNPFLDSEIRTNLPTLERTIKFVIWSNPINILNNGNNYGLVTIYGGNLFQNHLAYARCGDESWSSFNECAEMSYCDIVSSHHLVYALSESYSVEAWNFKTTVPIKIMTIKPGFSQGNNIEFGDLYQKFYFDKFYLVVSKDKLLMVRKQIGYHVRDDGLVVCEENIDDDEHACYGFRYLTKFFHIFKLDLVKAEWAKVEDLGNGVAFLGGNESVLAHSGNYKEYEKNSIYFSDDNWDGMDLMDNSGGHDNGIYRVKDRSIEWLFDSSPFWVIPHST